MVHIGNDKGRKILLLDAREAVAKSQGENNRTQNTQKERLPPSCPQEINHNTQEGISIYISLSEFPAHLLRRLPIRLFRPSANSLGRDVDAAALMLRWRTRHGGEPERLLLCLEPSPRPHWGTISYSPPRSRTDWARPTLLAAASLAFRSLSIVNPGSALPFRSSG